MSEIRVGDLFPTYLDFEAKLKLYKIANSVDFYISDSRTLESARKRCPNIIQRMPEALKYYYIKLKCVQGGTFKAKKSNKGIRETMTLKQDCKAFMYIKVDEASCQLIVSSMVEDHNHDVSPALFSRLPSQKKLSPESKQKVFELLKLKANKKMVQQKVLETTGKHLTLRDLSNISVTGKNPNDDLDHVINELKTKYNCCVQLFVDSEDNFRGIFIQDERMRSFYDAYPQLIFADSTYKLLDIRIPVFVLMAEDGNGQSEVICVGLLVYEDKQTLKWFFETFRSENEVAAQKTVIIMTDKDLTERAAIREIFPDAFLRICLFHVLRSFNREVTCQKMGITPNHRDLVKDLLLKICHCTNLEDYEKITKELKDVAEKSVWTYFDVNWNNIKEEWSSVASYNICSYLNSTNNRIESFNSKLKSVCTHFSSLEKFVNNLFIVLKSLRAERDDVASKVLLKMPTKPLMDVEEENFFHVLTPYAFSKVREQLNQSKAVDLQTVMYDVNHIMCTCKFKFSMCLPCKHIFAYRRKNGLPIFDENLYDERWSRKYFVSHLSMLKDTNTAMFCEAENSPTRITVMESIKTKTLTTQEKYKKAILITNKLASIIAEKSQNLFEERLEFLENVYQLWCADKQIVVAEVAEAARNISTPTNAIVPQLLNFSELDTTSQISEVTAVTLNVHNSTHSENANISVLDETSSTKKEEDFVKKIVMPSKVLMKGRPKGATLTAIGLPKKKKSSIVSFQKKSYVEKQDIVLSWFLDHNIIRKIKKENYLVEETDIECRPEKITSAVFHEAVDMNLIRCFFSLEGWAMLQSVIETKKVNHTLSCSVCFKDIGAESTIVCALCLLTYHSKCVGQKIKKREWYCYSCQQNQI